MRFISYSSDVTFLADASAAGVAELKKSCRPLKTVPQKSKPNS
jgi:hypothetical protein